MSSSLKACRCCGEEKPEAGFYFRRDAKKSRNECKTCLRKRARERYRNDIPRHRHLANQYYRENRDDRRAAMRTYNHRRRSDESYRKQDNARIQARKTARERSDPAYRALQSCRRRLYELATQRGFKKERTSALLGCSAQHLRNWLEAQFSPGMSWDNHGKWHIDHKRPCASFDFSQPENIRACFHFTNLQPLWAHDNLCKSKKF